MQDGERRGRIEDKRIVLEVNTDTHGLSKLAHNRHIQTLMRGADMGIKMIKTAVNSGAIVVAVLDKSGKFEVLETLADCERVFAGSREIKDDGE